MNHITIELCQEDRARLDAILTALQSCGTPYIVTAEKTQEEATVEAVQEPQDEPAVEPEEVPAPEAEQPTAAEPAAPAVSLSDIQKKVVDLSVAGKKDQVREIIKAYATKVSAIPADKVDEVWQKLTALEG